MRHLVTPALWIVYAAALTISTIVLHELAHYLGAVSMGAQDVTLHWADISFAEGSMETGGVAVTWMAGPVLTHGIILWVWLSRTHNMYALALGLGASSRDLVLLPFTLKLLLGRDVSTFSNDEVTVAAALGMSPLPLALLAAGLGVSGTVIFLRRAYRFHPRPMIVALLAGTIAGIILWGIIGPQILPGGKGFD